MIKLLLVGITVLFAVTAVEAKTKAHKKPPAEKCVPYGEDIPQMCGTQR